MSEQGHLLSSVVGVGQVAGCSDRTGCFLVYWFVGKFAELCAS
jgi:hypothetical protein